MSSAYFISQLPERVGKDPAGIRTEQRTKRCPQGDRSEASRRKHPGLSSRSPERTVASMHTCLCGCRPSMCEDPSARAGIRRPLCGGTFQGPPRFLSVGTYGSRRTYVVLSLELPLGHLVSFHLGMGPDPPFSLIPYPHPTPLYNLTIS